MTQTILCRRGVLRKGDEYHAVLLPNWRIAAFYDSINAQELFPWEFEFVRCPRWLGERWEGVTQ